MITKVEFVPLNDWESYHIGDRIVYSKVVSIMMTGSLTTLLILSGIIGIILSNSFLIFLIVLVIFIVVIYKKNKAERNIKAWSRILGIYSIIWFFISAFVGFFFIFHFGVINSLWISVGFAIFYIIGYSIARIIREQRFKLKKKTWEYCIPTFLNLLINSTLVIGYMMNSLNFIYYNSSFGLTICPSCGIDIFIMISRVVIVLSMCLNYWMLYSLYKPGNNSQKKIKGGK